MESWDESMKSGDVRDWENADEYDWCDGEESKDLMWGVEVIGLFWWSV